MFSACLSEEAIELLVAHLFVKPLPFTAPCSRITGFLRLKLIELFSLKLDGFLFLGSILVGQ
jgi:hypothetical protein